MVICSSPVETTSAGDGAAALQHPHPGGHGEHQLRRRDGTAVGPGDAVGLAVDGDREVDLDRAEEMVAEHADGVGEGLVVGSGVGEGEVAWSWGECSRESGRVASMNTIPLTLSADDVVYAIDKAVPPRLRLAAPATVTIATLDARAGRLTRPDQVEATAPDYRDRFPKANPATGPIFVEGAEPGDVLTAEILRIELGRARLHAGEAGLRRDPRRGRAAGGALR